MKLNFTLIGERVKRVRKHRGLSQMQLAELIERSPTYISYIESGCKGMSLETLILLANALHVSSDDLLADHLENTLKAQNHSFASLLADCSVFERSVLQDMAIAIKQSIRTHREHFEIYR